VSGEADRGRPVTSDAWFDFLVSRIKLADPDEKRCGIRGLDRLIAVAELHRYLDEELNHERGAVDGAG
jgi:hypothetical protein